MSEQMQRVNRGETVIDRFGIERRTRDLQPYDASGLDTAIRAHRASGWSCSCGWPLGDSVGSWVDHLAAQIRPLMRCSATDPDGWRCRLFNGHDGGHGDGLGAVWDRDYTGADA